MRKSHDEKCLIEKPVRQPLKLLAQLVIDRHASGTEYLRNGDELLDATHLSPLQEAARQQVLAELAANSSIRRAFVNRFETNGRMVVTLGIRGVGTGELLIPAERLDQSSLNDFGSLLAVFEAQHG